MASNPAALVNQQQRLRKARVLIVGGGATGQVYGYHLAQGGARVSYYLKPKYAAEAEEGFTLYPYGMRGLRPTRDFRDFEIYTTPERIAHLHFDQVWLCVSSTAIYGDFVQKLYAVQPDAIWVSLQPGIEDRWHLQQTIPGEQLITGMIGIVAYQAPLPDEDEDKFTRPGIAYWQPPLSPSLFQGPEPFVAGIANTLRTGGLSAAVRPDVQVIARYGSGALMPLVIALEAQKWSAAELRSNPGFVDSLASSVREIFQAIERDTGKDAGFVGLLTKRWAWKLALLAAPTVTPFPFDPYFRFHFTKVRDQTEKMITGFLGYCRSQGIEPRALEELQRRWLERRRDLAADAAALPREAPQLAIGAAVPDGDTGQVGLAVDSEPTPPPGTIGGLVDQSAPTPIPGGVVVPNDLGNDDPGLDVDSETTPLPANFDFDDEIGLEADSEPTPLPSNFDFDDDFEPPSLEEGTDPEAEIKPVEGISAPADLADTEESPDLEARLAARGEPEPDDASGDEAELPNPEQQDVDEQDGEAEDGDAEGGDAEDSDRKGDDLDATSEDRKSPERLAPEDFVPAGLDDVDSEADTEDVGDTKPINTPKLPKPPKPSASAGKSEKKPRTNELPDLKARLAALRKKRKAQSEADESPDE